MRTILPTNILKSVYYALAQSIFDYGIISYGNAYANIISTLEVIQKKIIKVIMKKSNLYPTRQLFLEFKVFTIKQLYCKAILVKFLKSQIQFKNTGNIRTRSVNMCLATVPRMRTTAGQRSAQYLAPMLYNNLPEHFRTVVNAKLLNERLLEFFTAGRG